jgi:hypothetical protein
MYFLSIYMYPRMCAQQSSVVSLGKKEMRIEDKKEK